MKRTMEQSRIKLAELLYLIYFAIMFGARASGLYEGRLLYNISLLAGACMFLLKVIATEHTLFEYGTIALLIGMAGIVYCNTGEKGLLLYFTMMLGMKAVNPDRVMKWACVILGTCFTILVLITVCGLVPDIVYLKELRGFGEILRRSIGYPYPNTTFTTYNILMVLVMYLLRNQSRKIQYCAKGYLFIGALYMYLYTCSNTGIIVAVFFILVNSYFMERKSINKVEQFLLTCIYPGAVIFSVAGPLVTQGEVYNLLNKVLHNRWAYSKYYLTNEPVTLLGVRFGPAPNDNHMIDSSFLYTFMQTGIIPCILLIILMELLICRFIKENNRYMISVYVTFMLLGMSDPFLYNLAYKNLLFIWLGYYLYELLENKVDCLPAIFQRRICLLKAIPQDISLPRKYMQYIQWKKNLLKAVLTKQTIPTFFCYLVAAVLIFMASYLLTGQGRIIDRIDTATEWEYVRKVVSAALWGSAVIVIMKNNVKNRISKRG